MPTDASKFSVQELTAINTVLSADPSTADLVDRVMDALNDPGVSVPPNKSESPSTQSP